RTLMISIHPLRRKKIQPNQPAEKPSGRTPGLTFVILFFGLIALSGVVGFVYRPPQKTTFNARFAPDTKLRFRELQDQCPVDGGRDAPGLIKGTVSRVDVYNPFVRPLDIVLPMDTKVFETLANGFPGVNCRQCSSVEVNNSTLRLDFGQPLTVFIDGKGVNEEHFDRLADGNLEVRMYPASAHAQATQEAILQLRVINTGATMRMGVNGMDRGEFALYAGPQITKTIRLLPSPGSGAEGKVDLVYPGTQADKEIDLRAEICAKHMELEDTPQGILTLGPLVQKLGWGERLQLNMDRFDRMVLDDDRINLNARDCENAGTPQTPWTTSAKPCINSAVQNDVVELLPLWFTLWPDWAHGLWSTFAIGTGSATFLQFLKRLGLWPS
ncbi:MAG: hypothetical protein ACM3S0_09820, partial [Acidobacteriota bacterium]